MANEQQTGVSRRLFFITTGLLFIVLLSTIGVLLYVKHKAEKRLTNASQFLRELGEQYIDYTVHVEQTIPLKTEVNITRSIPVDIDMAINDSVMIHANVPVRDSMDVPIDLNIHELLGVDTNINIRKRVKMMLYTEIPINQKFRTTLLGKGMGIDIPIEATIPLEQPVYIEFPESMNIVSTIPVKLHLQDKMRIAVKLNVPMHQKIPLSLPVRERAMVSFSTTMPIEGQIPIVMDIPVRIPLRDTPIKLYLDKVADELDDMLSF